MFTHLRFFFVFFVVAFVFVADFFRCDMINFTQIACRFCVVRYMLRLLTGRRLPANLSYFEEKLGHFPPHGFGGQAVVSWNIASDREFV